MLGSISAAMLPASPEKLQSRARARRTSAVRAQSGVPKKAAAASSASATGAGRTARCSPNTRLSISG